MVKIYLDGEEQTKEIGYKLGKLLTPGSVICLIGDLGAGKTTMTQSLARAIGVDDYITSPTFTIVNEYNSPEINIYHFDVYRLNDIDEFYAIGVEEYFEKGICIIEWGEIIENALPKDYIKISFSRNQTEENKRILNIETFGNKYDNLF